ncbi:MAG TPA: tRNA (adenosine(37)-N6)-threonylcarbamoyltransferase complex transferase subunit TsaD [Candidatus Paceibacterota bacterium]|nr:tRNA (adenosine(37)-N6)-threonylcarbamoyltransferase complex transferase subunit TsaD [Candidatus Paceibacterota bacterium]
MKILSIETSCDETAVSVLECSGSTVRVLGNALSSQIDIHAQYGGVFPALAKRAHAEKIIPLLQEALTEAELLYKTESNQPVVSFAEPDEETKQKIQTICEQEPGLAEAIITFGKLYEAPDIDHIAVTTGPGLEPALWVGLNTAKALSVLWQKPIDAINHMEGHVLSAVFQDSSLKEFTLTELPYPLLALLVSGGHTELVLTESPLHYKKIGATRDDAIGEAFDKVARILGLPYPGGPKIAIFAKIAREANIESEIKLPRPMLHSKDYDFSFSGIKTATLYATKDKTLTDSEQKAVAREFEDAVVEVLVKKTAAAIEEFNIQTLVVGGGVAANTYLREQLEIMRTKNFPHLTLSFPAKGLSTDNSVMIAMASYYRQLHGALLQDSPIIRAEGNRSIESENFGLGL